VIGQSSEAKMLVSVKGVGDIVNFFKSKEYKLLLRSGHKIYAVASDEKIGNNINGEKVNRREFLDRLKTDGRDTMLKLIILHYDILAEGIDVPGITGIMPLRTLGKAKFLQTYGRAARLDIDDRKSIESGEIKPNELDKLMKPYAWVIIPTILQEDDDDKKHIEGLLNELRDYGFKPSEDILSINTKNGPKKEIGIDPLVNGDNESAKKTGLMIEKVEADFEAERIAALVDCMTAEEWLIHNFPQLKDKI
jgi:hypothetical protein